MLRRLASVGLLSLASVTFALRFAPPPARFDPDEPSAEEAEAPTTTAVTRPRFSTLPPATTTTLPPLPPGVQEVDSDFIRFGRGSLQLRVRIEHDVLVDIEMIRVPHSSERALQINTDTHPILRAEALELQDYRVHVVSGATETTYGWARALRDALEQANFCVGPTCNSPVR